MPGIPPQYSAPAGGGTVLEVREIASKSKQKAVPTRRDPRTWEPVDVAATRDAATAAGATPSLRVTTRGGQVLLRRRGGPDVALTSDAAPKREAHVSPNEQWVSYVRGGNLTIYDLGARAEWPVSVDGGAPDADGGGVPVGSHVWFMSLCRRFLRRGDEKLGPFVLGLVVRPLKLAPFS